MWERRRRRGSPTLPRGRLRRARRRRAPARAAAARLRLRPPRRRLRRGRSTPSAPTGRCTSSATTGVRSRAGRPSPPTGSPAGSRQLHLDLRARASTTSATGSATRRAAPDGARPAPRQGVQLVVHRRVPPARAAAAGAGAARGTGGGPGAAGACEGVPTTAPGRRPRSAPDGASGMSLYRANVSAGCAGPRDAPHHVPGAADRPHRATASSARRCSTASSAGPRRCGAARSCGGHWVPRTPARRGRAGWIAEFVDHVEGGPEPAGLLRVTTSGDTPNAVDGQLVVVTGAASGIGRATALRVRRAGRRGRRRRHRRRRRRPHRRAVPGSSARRGQAATRSTSATPRRWRSFAKAVAAEHGVADVLVNNAGIGIAGAFLDTTRRGLGAGPATSTCGASSTARRLFGRADGRARPGRPHRQHRVGRRVQPSRTLPAYATSKAAVLMLSECLRAELAGQRHRRDRDLPRHRQHQHHRAPPASSA